MLSHRLIVVAATAALAGCSTPPPPPRVPVPRSPSDSSAKTYEPLRPLQGQTATSDIPPPAFDDVPLVTQGTPEEPAYVDAYGKVGRPRLAVFVNRTIEGQIIAANPSGGQEAQRASGTSDATGQPLVAGEYDDAEVRNIDYKAIELALADTLGANGKVTLVSPTLARQRLSDQEVKDLQEGRPQVLQEIAGKLDADVLIEVQAKPTRQTGAGLGLRLFAEAINTKGGESVARSYVDIDPPLDKPTIDKDIRLLARKVMHGLAGSWNAMSMEPARSTDAREPVPPRLSPTTMPQ